MVGMEGRGCLGGELKMGAGQKDEAQHMRSIREDWERERRNAVMRITLG